MKNLSRERQALLRKFPSYAEFVRGSLTSVCATCHRAGCICDTETSRQSFRLTYKDRAQKTRIVYVPQRQLPRIRKMLANYARLRAFIEELLEANIASFKEQARR